jgi:hypothetical protein
MVSSEINAGALRSDDTDARKEARRCVGRSDRSRLVTRNDITPGQRVLMVRNAALFGPGVGLGPR